MKVTSAQTERRRWPGDYPERMSSLTKLELTQVSLRSALGSRFVEQSKKRDRMCLVVVVDDEERASISLCERKRSNTPGGRTWGRYDAWARKHRADFFLAMHYSTRGNCEKLSHGDLRVFQSGQISRGDRASFATLRIFSQSSTFFSLSFHKLHKMHYIFKSRWKLHKSLDLK